MKERLDMASNNGSDFVAQRANGWGYRPHLDGIRALAVYLVVLFHSGFGTFDGGFVGVDLFFVLSGFLVTTVLLVDASSHGRIEFGRFYARRARRLIPGASLTIAGVCIIAVTASSKLDRLLILPDARAASLWYANWHFIAEARDYFASGEFDSPLLHFWSLAIEEQFYLVYPLALFVLIRLGRGRLAAVTAAFAGLLLAGVGLQLWWAARDTNHAYLGTDARIYQPLAGVVLALVLWRFRLPVRSAAFGSALLGVSLVGLVLVSTLAPGASASWRGLAATAVSVGAILGGEMNPGGLVAKLLALRPMRYLGAISYGVYLWHWPVIAFSSRFVVMSPWVSFAVSASLGTALAALSYRYVEYPIRSATWFRAQRWATIGVGVAAALVVGLAMAPALLQLRIEPSVMPRAAASDRRIEDGTPVPSLDLMAWRNERGPTTSCRRRDASDCLLRRGDGDTVFVAGDSHAQMWGTTLMVLAEKHDWTLYLGAIGNCPWPQGIYRVGDRDSTAENCKKRRPRTYEQIDAVQPDLVVLAERGDNESRLTSLAASSERYWGLSGKDRYRAAIADSVAELSSPGRTILLVEPVPEVSADPLDCLSASEFIEECEFPAELDTIEDSIYREVANRVVGVGSLNLDADICDDVCPAMIGDVVTRYDKSHLTSTYATEFAPQFDNAITLLGQQAN